MIGDLYLFLVLQVTQNNVVMLIYKKHYVKVMLKWFGMEEFDVVSSPMT